MIALRWQPGIRDTWACESHEQGKFAWIMDPDGNKVELWEPQAQADENNS